MFPAFFLPEASCRPAKYFIVQNEVEVRLVDRDLTADYRREFEHHRLPVESKPAISEFTITDFRPHITTEGRKVLYLDDFHLDVLSRYLTGKHGHYLVDSYWNESNGRDEESVMDDDGPFQKRLSYLNQLLRILRGHWDTGWHFATHPLINSVVLNMDLKTAIIYFENGSEGWIALMQRGEQGWCVTEREFTCGRVKPRALAPGSQM